MRIVQKLNRKYNDLESLVIGTIKFEDKFEKLNIGKTLKCFTNMEIGEEYLLDIVIFDEDE